MRGLLIMYMACPAGELGLAPSHARDSRFLVLKNADWQAMTAHL